MRRRRNGRQPCVARLRVNRRPLQGVFHSLSNGRARRKAEGHAWRVASFVHEGITGNIGAVILARISALLCEKCCARFRRCRCRRRRPRPRRHRCPRPRRHRAAAVAVEARPFEVQHVGRLARALAKLVVRSSTPSHQPLARASSSACSSPAASESSLASPAARAAAACTRPPPAPPASPSTPLGCGAGRAPPPAPSAPRRDVRLRLAASAVAESSSRCAVLIRALVAGITHKTLGLRNF